MPEVLIELASQRGRPVADRPRTVTVRGRQFVHIPAADVEYRDSVLVMDVPPDTYTLELDIDGFRLFRGRLKIRNQTRRAAVELIHRCTKLPLLSELAAEQERLLGSFSGSSELGRIWRGLTDNQACTFFQVTYALKETTVSGTPLSTYLERVERIGGSEIVADIEGQTKRAVGWRLHVGLRSEVGADNARILRESGFEADSGPAHPTHGKFGFEKSFRQKGRNPRLQLVFARDFLRADIDLDNGQFHLSSPYHVYSALRKRFPKVDEIYRVT